MRFDRRQLLLGAGSIGALGAICPLPAMSHAGGVRLDLVAEGGRQQLLDPGEPDTPIWGYGGRTPGPTIRIAQGGELHATLRNALDEDTTIHWHGIRIDNAMDGVAHLTQAAVKPGGTFDYRFTLPDAGTYWYHPHAHKPMQQDRGLYGLLIVEEKERVSVDREVALVIDDWRIEDSGEIETASLSSLHDAAHAGRYGNIMTVNGKPFERLPVKSGERLRVRICSPCNSRILKLRFEDVKAQIIAIDGQPVDPVALPDAAVTLGPSQRVDLAVDFTGAPGSKAAITEVSRERLVIGEFELDDRAVQRDRVLDSAVVLPATNAPRPDAGGLKDALRFELVMTGGARGSMDGAVYRGKHYPIRELAQKHRMVWAFNGEADPHDAPLFEIARGRTAVLRLVNNTAWPHGIHTHGHHFQVIDRSIGSVNAWLRDSILMEPREIVEIAFVADNPGKWMIHCHMLEHQMAGMQAWFNVDTQV